MAQEDGGPAKDPPAPSEGQKGKPEEAANVDDELFEDEATREEEEKLLDDGEWEEMLACPFDVRFTQEKIHPFFYRRGPIVNVLPKIRPILYTAGCEGGEEEDVVELVPPFTAIRCLRKQDELWSLDNRRLYALQMAAMEQWPMRCRIRILCRDKLPRHKFKTQYRKFNTTSGGRAITVCARYKQFDEWNWFNRAVEVECDNFSDRVGSLMSGFQVVPVIAALLFRTGITGFTSRVPFIVGIILSFAVDFLRQKVPVIERRLGALHVRALRNGDAHQVCTCWRRLRGGDGNEEETPLTSAPQLAAQMALVLVLLLPYVLGVSHEKLRSSLISCWLGVACMLTVQLGLTFRNGDNADTVQPGDNGLSPKHRD